MTRLFCILFFLAQTHLKIANSAGVDRYKAAVVEYRSIWEKAKTPRENILANANKYSEIIKTAANYKTDIIVFPEIGLMNYDHHESIEVPDPKEKIIPALDPNQDEVLQIISKAAKEGSMYVVINFHENYKNESKYNTNVVFDRNGTIISRYRKFNLYGESYLNTTKEPEIIVFETDFGVKFGTFICFDILFEKPPMNLVQLGIHDIVYPTAWFNELPFLSAIQAQFSWSYGNNMNFLAANHNDIKKGSTGSGLYRGRKIKSLSRQTIMSGSFMIVGNMPKYGYPILGDMINDDVVINLESGTVEDTFSFKDDINAFQSQLINSSFASKVPIMEKGARIGYSTQTTEKTEICDKDFCCNFDLTYSSIYYSVGQIISPNYISDFNKFRYRYLVMNGEREFHNVVKRYAGMQICAIGPCIEDSLSTCFQMPKKDEVYYVEIDNEIHFLHSTNFIKINITAKFDHGTSILPNIFESSPLPNSYGTVLDPDNFIFTSKNLTDGIKANILFKSKSLISGGLWGRVFSRDWAPNTANVPCANITPILALTAISLFYYCNRKL